jgi:hypothetical protein
VDRANDNEDKMKNNRVLVRAFCGNNHWTMLASDVCKFSNSRIIASFFIVISVYLTSGISTIFGNAAIAVAVVTSSTYINYISSKYVERFNKIEIEENLDEIYTAAPLILILAISFAGISLVQRALSFYGFI